MRGKYHLSSWWIMSTPRQPGSQAARQRPLWFSPRSYIYCRMVLNNSLPFRSSTFVNGILRDNIGKGIDSLLFVKNQGLSWAWCSECLWSQDLEGWCGRIKNWRPTWTTYPDSKNQTNQANKTQSKSKQALRDCFYCYLAISSSRQDKVIHKQSLSVLIHGSLASTTVFLTSQPIYTLATRSPESAACPHYSAISSASRSWALFQEKGSSWHFIKKLATFPASELNLSPGQPSVAWGVC